MQSMFRKGRPGAQLAPFIQDATFFLPVCARPIFALLISARIRREMPGICVLINLRISTVAFVSRHTHAHTYTLLQIIQLKMVNYCYSHRHIHIVTYK